MTTPIFHANRLARIRDNDQVIRHVHRDIRDGNNMRDKVYALQDEMLKLPQVKLDLNHYLANDVYVRELIIPKDVTIVGKIHKYDHVVIVIKGELSFLTDVNEVQRVKAPFIAVSKAGAKRAIYAHEDSIMVTVHKYSGEVDKADDFLVFEKEADWLDFNNQEPLLPLGEAKNVE